MPSDTERKIIRSQQYLSELASQIASSETCDNAELESEAEKRISTWEKALQVSNQEQFSTRLSWLGLSIKDLPKLTNGVGKFKSSLILQPSYFKSQNSINTFVASEVEKALRSELPNTDSSDIRLFCSFFSKYAVKSLSKKCPDIHKIYSENVFLQIKLSLTDSVHGILSQIIENEFTAFCILNNSSIEDRKERLVFESIFLKEGMVLLFSRYSAAMRLITTTILNWVEFNSEFIARYIDDRYKYISPLLNNYQIKQITSIKQSISDKHSNGKSVILVEFDNSHRVIYKPHNLSVDNYFSALTKQLSAIDSTFKIKTPASVDLDEYGWCEFINNTSLNSQDEAHDYYKNAGTLLFILYLLIGTDAHQGNIIASGVFPVLIDLETLFHQEWINKSDYEKKGQLSSSVMRTGILPRWSTGMGGEPDRLGGLVPENKNLLLNVPKFSNGDYAQPSDYIFDILNGFRSSYLKTLDYRESGLLKSLSPLALKRLESRYVPRSTEAYSQVLKRSLRPSSLHTGIDRSISIDVLAYLHLSKFNTEDKLPPSILNEEIKAIENGNIPIFHTRLASRSLYIKDKVIARNFFHKSSIRLVQEKLSSLNRDDLSAQLEIIEISFSLHDIKLDSFGKLKPSIRNKNISQSIKGLKIPSDGDIRTKALNASESIGLYILEKSINESSCEIDWITPKLNNYSGTYNLSNINNSLFQGRSGIAVYFSILSCMTGSDRFHNATFNIISKVVSTIRKSKSFLYTTNGIGALDGAFGQIYALATISKIFDKEDFIETIVESLNQLDPDLINKDEKLDLVSGVSGVLLCLLKVRTIACDPIIDKLIQICIERLMDTTVALENGCAWKTSEGRILTGLSHGSAGICSALASAYKIYPDNEIKKTIQDAIEYENSRYSDEAKNWPDQRYDSLKYSIGWSHGSPGIGLSRLAMKDLKFLKTHNEISNTFDSIAEFKGEIFDYIVSGRASHLAFLSWLNDIQPRPECKKLIDKTLELMFSEVEQFGYFNLPFKPNRIMETPSLFTGISGIGLSLIQASGSFDKKLPRVWLLD